MESLISQFTALQITQGETNTKLNVLRVICGALTKSRGHINIL